MPLLVQGQVQNTAGVGDETPGVGLVFILYGLLFAVMIVLFVFVVIVVIVSLNFVLYFIEVQLKLLCLARLLVRCRGGWTVLVIIVLVIGVAGEDVIMFELVKLLGGY